MNTSIHIRSGRHCVFNIHVHLLIHYPPKVSLSKLVNSLKGVSSRYLRKHFTDLSECFWGNALWSPSYFSGSCGGAPIDIVRKYIESQKLQHEESALYPSP